MILLTGGGTGGHLSIVRSLKEELNQRGLKPVFIGSENGQDKSWFEEDEGFKEKYFLNTKGVVNKNKFAKLLSLATILLYSIKCYFIFKRYGITKVISVGGYSAAPASIAAIIFKKELFIHEQNARPGSLNQKLKPYCKAFFSSYQKDSPIKNYPVKKEFFKLSREREKINRVIFLGGSQGASFINTLAKDISPYLLKKGMEIIHQCGKKEYKEIKDFYSKHNLSVEVYDFIEELAPALRRADIAISRSGASTLWELCANRLPAIFIPYPYAVSNHQYHNAKFLEDLGAAKIVEQKDASKDKIISLLDQLDIKTMSKNLEKTISPDGAKSIINFVISH